MTKMQFVQRKGASLTVIATCLLTCPAVAAAQAADASASVAAATESSSAQPASEEFIAGEVVVQARRRSETQLSIPVAVTALGAADLAKAGATDLPAVARLVPQLIVANSGNAQGGIVSFRGIASATESNNLSDQSVSFNVDGAQVSRASISRLGQLDLAQVEVLKGPQALFFGKNSPAGIISLRSADPTSTFYASGAASYDFEAREVRGEAVVSGPLTDTLGGRLAFAATSTDGWMKNDAPATATFPPKDRRFPHGRELMGRLTLKFQPTDNFDAKLKVAYSDLHGSSALLQPVFCPTGRSQLGDPGELCHADNRLIKGDLGPNVRDVYYGYRDGEPYMHVAQGLGTLEMNYRPTDDLTLTSLTSYYRLDNEFVDNFTPTATATRTLANYGIFGIRETAQELRLASSYGGMFDFLVGGYFQDGYARNAAVPALNMLAPRILSNADYQTRYKTYSGFAQLLFRPIPTLELAAGGRYTKEKKHLDVFLLTTGAPVPTLVHDRTFDNFSPELSATWRPTSRMTLYANYKKGFLSGGYNAGAGSPSGDRSYLPQKIHGEEVGFKALLADGTVRTNIQAFNYVVTGLQITSIGQNLVQTVSNAGRAKSRGIEADLTWTTPVEGLTLRGAVAYNHARYAVFNAPCYRGQTIAQGCAINPTASGAFSAQDLNGQQVVRSPDWAGSVGFEFDRPVGSVRVGLLGDMTFSSGYFGDATNNPFSRQGSYQLLNATVRVHDPDEKWELALIGRNLTNEHYVTRTVEIVGTGAGGGTNGPSTLADVGGEVARGRQIVLRASYRFQ